MEFLLSDTQTRIEVTGMTRYRHFASKALDSNGVDDIAAISMSFDPTYQSLVLHRVDIVRNGTRIDKLRSATIRVLSRETRLEYKLFDGNKTINVAIDDVRIGDTVEYSYTLSGLNPVFNNLVSGAAPLQWSVPVDRVFMRLLVPVGRHISLNAMNTKVQAEMREADGMRDYRWNQIDVPALRIEKDAPRGYDPYASVQWSEFPDWKSVVAWGLPLYRPASNPGAAVTAEIELIRTTAATPQQRLSRVLHLVQSDIRYLGVEVGAGSHAPAAPALVYQRRFGDCKDKAMLMITMLKALGIEANAALVSTDRSIVAASAATPHAFNHVLVRATIGTAIYWLDPTRAPQKGDLAHVYQADHGLALVLDKSTSALVQMAPPVGTHTRIRAVFDSSAGFDKPVKYTVVTTQMGEAADTMRARIASGGLADKEKDYLNFYARTYPDIKLAAPLALKDDEQNNTITLTESYVIGEFWPFTKSNKQRHAFIVSSELGSLFRAPTAVNRTAPLKVNFPDVIEEVTEVKLPTVWNIDKKSTTVSDAAFTYVSETKLADGGRTLMLNRKYQALADRVEPGAMGAYASKLRLADTKVAYNLYWNVPTKGEMFKDEHEVWIVAAFLACCGWIWMGMVWFNSPGTHSNTDGKILLLFIVVSALLLGLALLPWVLYAIALGLLIFGMGTQVMARLANHAPTSHWIYPCAVAAETAPKAPYCAVLIVGAGALSLWAGLGLMVVTVVSDLL